MENITTLLNSVDEANYKLAYTIDANATQFYIESAINKLRTFLTSTNLLSNLQELSVKFSTKVVKNGPMVYVEFSDINTNETISYWHCLSPIFGGLYVCVNVNEYNKLVANNSNTICMYLALGNRLPTIDNVLIMFEKRENDIYSIGSYKLNAILKELTEFLSHLVQ